MSTLRDFLPVDGHNEVPARVAKLFDVEVVQFFTAYKDDDFFRDYTYCPWVGSHRNVGHFVLLANGVFVGFNESPSHGWGYPIVSEMNALAQRIIKQYNVQIRKCR